MKILKIQYLRTAVFSGFSFLICHVYNLLHLINKGLTLTLQNKVTLDLKEQQNPLLIKHTEYRQGLKVIHFTIKVSKYPIIVDKVTDTKWQDERPYKAE